jgi:hypothetical protein
LDKNKYTDNEINSALLSASSSGIIELVKLMPGIGAIIEAYRSYKTKIQEINLKHFLEDLFEKTKKNSGIFDHEYYKTEEGRQFSAKIFETAIESQYFEKIDFFVNALINGKDDYANYERLRFIEIIKSLSKPSLYVLSTMVDNYHKLNEKIPNIQSISKMIGMDPFLVDSCIHEIKAQGIISENIGWGGPGNQRISIASGESGVTAFTIKFEKFITINEE